MKQKILLMEDDNAIRFGYARFLSLLGYKIIEAEDLSSAFRLASEHIFQAVIVDINLPDGNGLDIIDKIKRESPAAAIIVVTGVGDIPLAVEAMRKGADNFLVKPVDMNDLELFLKKTVEVNLIKRTYGSRKNNRDVTVSFGASGKMRKVYELASIAATSHSPVLITGETGTGKGVIAKWIHQQSDRSPQAFVDLNCSGLKGDLLACELFGNTRGAFTSADRDRDGLLDLANHGTLFLDEIGEMDLTVQANFLKVLEEKKYRKLGEIKVRESDFRLICATNRTLEQDTYNGCFRKDLFFRINTFPIHLPALSERVEDIPFLIEDILTNSLNAAVTVKKDAIEYLKTYHWPGNIRELKNVLERTMMISTKPELEARDFEWLANSTVNMPTDRMTLDEIERLHIVTMINRFHGDYVKAAQSLGISRATIYRKMKKT